MKPGVPWPGERRDTGNALVFMVLSAGMASLRAMLLPTARRSASRSRPEPLAAKVPAVGLLFWTIKLVTTGIGEATSDFLGNTNVALAGVVGLVGFWWALRRQLDARSYHAPTYWFAVLMVAVFGTMAADGFHDGTGVSYTVTTAFYAIVVAAILVAWRRSEGTLSIHSITTRRRERFYWGTVLATFALGTAAGDLTAIELHLGFLDSAWLFAAAIVVPAILHGTRRLNPVAAFWTAYVITRPLGASFADWFGKPHAQTGLGLGDGTVTLLGLLLFAALVVVATVRRRDVQPHLAHGADLPGLSRIGLRTRPAESD